MSTIGSLLHEVKQERVLNLHVKQQYLWDKSAKLINQKIFSDKKAKRSLGKLKSQTSDRFESVMMRDVPFIEKMQRLKAIEHLREKQNMNTNVGWIFTLRQSQFDSKRNSQQYLPAKGDINAVIVPKPPFLNQVFLKQEFEKFQSIPQEYRSVNSRVIETGEDQTLELSKMQSY